ncbi:hypothetical protein WH47_12124, partial [Habropoda laboriosa]
VHSDVYSVCSVRKVRREAAAVKRPELLNRDKVIFHRDKCQTTCGTKRAKTVAPSDYHLFPCVKTFFSGDKI